MEKLLNKIIVLLMLANVISCKPAMEISNACQNDKIHFDLKMLDENGSDLKTHQPIDYEFCITDNETALAEVLSINPKLKKTSSKGRSKCGENELLMLGNTDNKAFRSMLCKISTLDSVKEINQTYWE
jgi:hypothetical protein